MNAATLSGDPTTGAIWLGIALTAVACYALKFAGLSVPQRVLEHPFVIKVAELIPLGLLGALIAYQVFVTNSGDLVVDARVAALGVAALLLWLRAPFLVMVFAAAATAALIRYFA